MIVAALIVLGPLAAAGLALVARRFAGAVAVAGAALGAAAALRTLFAVAAGSRLAVELPGLPGFPLRLVVDPLGALLAAAVAVVSLAVFAYAVGYMAEERDRPRFFAAMAFFAAAMQTLVLAGDWILFLVAWELIALASYLLIGFWYERPGVAGAATRAFATTRAADVGLYLAVFTVATAAGSTELGATRNVAGVAATVAGLAFLLAAIGKSAQVPMQGWLLDAMAGPTPVSALLHSATLVVAGVVLLARASPLLSPEVGLVVGLVGGVTAVVAGLMAVAQRDLKRLLAASTSSQLGSMLLALGAGSIGAAVAHLIANAAMKSALFLGAGIFQHARHSTDLDDLAAVGRERRAAFVAFAAAGLALAGIPPLVGFWSKDAVIAATLHAPRSWLLAPFALAAAPLTGVYVGRVLRRLWTPALDRLPAGAAPRAAGSGWMIGGLALLAGLAAVLGVALAPIGRLLDVEIPEDVAGTAAGLVAAAVGLILGWAVPAERLLGPAYRPALGGFRLDGGVDGLVARPSLALARRLDALDRRLHAAVLGVGRGALRLAGIGRTADAGLDAVVLGVGLAAMEIAGATRLTDERGIDGLIADLVDGTRRLGVRARRLQTGLVHRELLVATAATAVILAVILIF